MFAFSLRVVVHVQCLHALRIVSANVCLGLIIVCYVWMFVLGLALEVFRGPFSGQIFWVTCWGHCKAVPTMLVIGAGKVVNVCLCCKGKQMFCSKLFEHLNPKAH